MPSSVQAVLLGIVQGLTEFLPVSSAANLILARAFFGFDGDKFGLSFDVACHVGTLLAVVAYFKNDVAAMIAALPRMFGPARLGPAEAGHHIGTRAERHAGRGPAVDERPIRVAVADREP